MTDRELLELAAKAVGLRITWEPDHKCHWINPGQGIQIDPWNPLRDDGQALRLAVALQAAKGASWVICLSIGDNRSACEGHYGWGADPAANVRRAIVIAAAEHGKAVP